MKKINWTSIFLFLLFLLTVYGGLSAGKKDKDRAFDEGWNDGYSAGYEEGKAIGYEDSLFDNGTYEDGYEDGYSDGYSDAGAATLAPKSGHSISPDVPVTPNPSQPDLGFDIDWQDVDSSMFSQVGYDDARYVLGVRFLDSGKCYYYIGFPSEEYEAFIGSDSLGRYYNEYITGEYYSFREDGSPTGAIPG